MRITDEKLRKYQEAYDSSDYYKSKFDEISNHYKVLFDYPQKDIKVTFNMIYPSEKRIVIAHYRKLFECVTGKKKS